MNVIGISEEDLAIIVENAVRRGYEAARRDMEADEWLIGGSAIRRWLNPQSPIAPSTFRDNRRKGVYGEAIIGRGENCRARKSDLTDAIRRYQLERI